MDGKKYSLPLMFDPESIGSSLKEVSNELIETQMQDVVNKWYHSPQDTDLLLWYDEKANVIKQQLSFFGQVVEWNVVDGVRTGYVVDGEDKKINYDDELQGPSIYKALLVIENTGDISEEERLALIYNFKNSPQISKMDPEFLLKTFGLRSNKASFFQKIILKILRLLS